MQSNKQSKQSKQSKQQEIIEELYKALRTASEDNDVTVAYAGYVFFCGLGGIILQNESREAFEKYVEDIRRNFKKSEEAQRSIN